MFTSKDVAEYYDTTHEHYERFWKLDEAQSLHYGIWDDGVKTFVESLVNTNKVLMELAGIGDGDRVLDAGCGIGGALRFVARHHRIEGVGITLSERQVAVAREKTEQEGLTDQLQFEIMDFTQMSFPSNSFDVVWACESVCHALDKSAFIKEAYRVLKPGGRLVMSDYFTVKSDYADSRNWLTKWGATWGVASFESVPNFNSGLKEAGFTSFNMEDITHRVRKSAKRMYHNSLIGWIPIEIWNLFHPKVRRFTKHHYRSGYYSYRALKNDLWCYCTVKATK